MSFLQSIVLSIVLCVLYLLYVVARVIWQHEGPWVREQGGFRAMVRTEQERMRKVFDYDDE